MSVTQQVANPKSPLGSFVREHFPLKNDRSVLAKLHKALGTDLSTGGLGDDTPSWARGLIGHAIDYRIRYHFEDLPAERLKLAQEGAWVVTDARDFPEAEIVEPAMVPKSVIRKLKEQPWGDVHHGEYQYRRQRGRIERKVCRAITSYLNFVHPRAEVYLPINCTAEFFNQLTEVTNAISAHRRSPTRDEELTLARYCLVLGVFESQWRTKWRRWPPSIIEDAKPSSAVELLNAIPDAWVLDVAEMATQFHTRHAGSQGVRAILSPEFSGARDVGGADGDLIVDGCLWEIKCTVRKRGEGAWVHQLLSYVLLDYENEYGIEHVGFIFPRQDTSIRWPLIQLIERLCVPPLSISELRSMLSRQLSAFRKQTR